MRCVFDARTLRSTINGVAWHGVLVRGERCRCATIGERMRRVTLLL